MCKPQQQWQQQQLWFLPRVLCRVNAVQRVQRSMENKINVCHYAVDQKEFQFHKRLRLRFVRALSCFIALSSGFDEHHYS